MPPDRATTFGFEALAGAYLPGEHIDDMIDAIAYTVRLQPGGHIDVPAGWRPDSATLEYVLAGAYTIRSEGH